MQSDRPARPCARSRPTSSTFAAARGNQIGIPHAHRDDPADALCYLRYCFPRSDDPGGDQFINTQSPAPLKSKFAGTSRPHLARWNRLKEELMAEVKPAVTRCFWFCAEALSKGPGRRPRGPSKTKSTTTPQVLPRTSVLPFPQSQLLGDCRLASTATPRRTSAHTHSTRYG